MKTNHVQSYLLYLIIALGTTGCTAYRVSSNLDPMPNATPTARSVEVTVGPVLISESSLPGRKYTEIGPIDVSVKKLTIFHKDPTREQANDALIEKARIIGANAVIKVKYTSGIGLMTWGYVDAAGTAVKLFE